MHGNLGLRPYSAVIRVTKFANGIVLREVLDPTDHQSQRKFFRTVTPFTQALIE